MSQSRPALRLVRGALDTPEEWAWFCGHCAAPAPAGGPPPPVARVCSSCGLGLLLESRADIAPSENEAFLVVDSSLLIQAVSRRAEDLLALPEELAVNRPVSDLVVPAEDEASSRTDFAVAILAAVEGRAETGTVYVRPSNTSGVRMRARVGTCGPPRAALVVLDESPSELQPVTA